MADKKISQLTAASTPLAGTEVLPIVQSSATVKVASDDLTVKNIRSNATNGILQVAGPGASATRVMTVPDANFTVARTDAANSFTGDQTLSTGNVIIGTAGKGIDFSANTAAAGMTSELLTWYEEGTWTPAMTASTSGTITINFSFSGATYTRVGRKVTCLASMYVGSVNSPTGNLFVEGLPFTIGAVSPAGAIWAAGLTVSANNFLMAAGTRNNTTVIVQGFASGATAAAAPWIQAGSEIRLNLTYFV